MTAIIAHRGRHDVARENTLEAFALAREAGADGVELDVRRTRDGVLVVHHDPLVEGRSIATSDRATLASHVCELADALRAAAPLLVNVEVKNLVEPGGVYDETGDLARAVVAEVARTRLRGPVVYSSFDLATCRDLARAAGEVGWLCDVGEFDPARVELAAREGLAALHPHVGDVTAELVALAHERGLGVRVWTVNDPRDLARMFEVGVDAVITDDVATARARRERPDGGVAALA